MDEVEEVEDNECPDHKEVLLAYIRQLRAEGVVFTSASDMPDDSGEAKSHGQHYTMFSTTSRFGR